MNAPYFGLSRIGSRSATAFRAGSSPTFSSHRPIAAGAATNFRNGRRVPLGARSPSA